MAEGCALHSTWQALVKTAMHLGNSTKGMEFPD